MYNVVGLLICVAAVIFSNGWRSRSLGMVICLYYLTVTGFDALLYRELSELGVTHTIHNRNVADIQAFAFNAFTLMAIAGACLTTYANQRRKEVPLLYSGWLLFVIVAFTVIHLLNWEGPGVSDGIITALQLCCVTADVLASWMAGDNSISRRVFRRLRSRPCFDRRRDDMAHLERSK